MWQLNQDKNLGNILLYINIMQMHDITNMSIKNI